MDHKSDKSLDDCLEKKIILDDSLEKKNTFDQQNQNLLPNGKV